MCKSSLLQNSTNAPLYFCRYYIPFFRRMDIRDVIKRPSNEICKIVGVPPSSNGAPDWETFFNPTCPRDVSPP